MTGYGEAAGKTLTSTSLAVEHGDYFKITGTASAADQWTNFQKDITDVSTATYTRWIVRFKTSVDSSGLGAGVSVIYDDGGATEEFLVEKQFSTTWTVETGTLANSPGADNVDKIRFYATSDAACTAEYVHFDFALLHQGTFTFPSMGDKFNIQFPPRNISLKPPLMAGDRTQNLGCEPAFVVMEGEMTTLSSAWKRTLADHGVADNSSGAVLFDLSARNTDSDNLWYWLTWEDGAFKVCPWQPWQIGWTGKLKRYSLCLKEYRNSSGDNPLEDWKSRFGLT